MTMKAISTAQATDTSSTGVELAGISHIIMVGTWGGSTAKLQASADGGTTYVDVPGSSNTANATFVIECGEGCLVRVNTAGGADASISTYASGVP